MSEKFGINSKLTLIPYSLCPRSLKKIFNLMLSWEEEEE